MSEKRDHDEYENDPFIDELKKIRTDHADRIVPHPMTPTPEELKQFVRDLEDLIKENIVDDVLRIKLFELHDEKYWIPSNFMFKTNAWWNKLCTDWAPPIVQNLRVYTRYDKRFRDDLNDLLDAIENAWFNAHPKLEMTIDVNAFDPEEGEGVMTIIGDQPI